MNERVGGQGLTDGADNVAREQINACGQSGSIVWMDTL